LRLGLSRIDFRLVCGRWLDCWRSGHTCSHEYRAQYARHPGQFHHRTLKREVPPAYKPGSVRQVSRLADGHFSRRVVTHAFQQPTRGVFVRVDTLRRLFGLAPTGVCQATRVTTCAVSSYLAVSPLPTVSRWRFVFCCAVRHLAFYRLVPRRYLAVCPWSPDFPRNSIAMILFRDRPAGGTTSI